ncbi:MAG: tail fiber domain-containing protein, partial [Ignavibacteria bacterium]
TLGNNQITSLRCNVTSISSLSDSRDKTNIKDLSLGIDFIMKIKPRLFNWDKREWYENNLSDGSKMKEEPTAGFIAQELDEVQTTENAEWLNLVLKDNPEKLEATYGNLLPVMVKAIQELKFESEKLKVESEKLRVESEKLIIKNGKLETESIELKNENRDMKKMFLELELTQNKLITEFEKYKLKEKKITEVKKGEQK